MVSYANKINKRSDYLKQEMQALGLQVREDAIGNIWALEGQQPDLPVVIVGSHFDCSSWRAFDGPAGIVTGLMS